MTLATTCPNCHTSFKVVPDQLKLRRGLVRCGKCQQVFSGIDFLTYVEPADAAESERVSPPGALTKQAALRTPSAYPDSTILAAAQARAMRGEAAAPASVPPASSAQHPYETDAPRSALSGAQSDGDRPHAATDLDAVAPEARDATWFMPHTRSGGDDTGRDDAAPATTHTVTPPDPSITDSSPIDATLTEAPPTDVALADVPLTDGVVAGATLNDTALPDTEAVDREPTDATLTGAAPDEPAQADTTHAELEHTEPVTAASSFHSGDVVALNQTLAEPLDRDDRSRWPAMAVAALLALALGAQAIIGWRDEIAARLPFAAPLLTPLVATFGWTVAAPRNRAALSIESFELRARSTSGEYELSALLSNRAEHPVTLPALELTLTDNTGAVMLRRVLTTTEYADGQSGASNVLPGRSERAVRLRLALNGPAPAGYSADLFYP